MKPSVPETGTVIRTEGGRAIILLKGGHACRGCGAAKIGLCRAGGSDMFLTADNPLKAGPGDVVMVGLSRRVQWKGYLLAYIIPLAALLTGAVAGHVIGNRLNLPASDALSALALLAVASAFSLRRLRRLDADHVMEVKRVLSDAVFHDAIETDEERAFGGWSC